MDKISLDLATLEFEKWLDFKKIKDRKREANKDQEEILIDAIKNNNLIISEDFNLEYNLEFPLKNDDGDATLESLSFKPRLKVFEINNKMKGVKSNDVDGRVLGYIAASTGKNTGLLKKLDTEDYSIAQAIIMYFL